MFIDDPKENKNNTAFLEDSSDDSDSGDSDDDGDENPLHSTMMSNSSEWNLHLSDDTIYPDQEDGKKKSGSNFQTYRERKRTESTGAEDSDSSTATDGSFNAGLSSKAKKNAQFGGKENTPSNKSSRKRKSSGQTPSSKQSGSESGTSFDASDMDDVFVRPKARPESRDNAANASQPGSSKGSPSSNPSKSPSQGTAKPSTSWKQQPRRRSRSINRGEDLADRMQSMGVQPINIVRFTNPDGKW